MNVASTIVNLFNSRSPEFIFVIHPV